MMQEPIQETNQSFSLQASVNHSTGINHPKCHTTVIDDLVLLDEKESFILLLVDSVVMVIVLCSSMLAVNALYKTRGKEFTTPNLLMFCLSFSDSCSSFIYMIFNFALLYNKYATCVQGFRLLVTFMSTASQISFTLMILSGINRFLRIRLLLHYDGIITTKVGKRMIALSIVLAVVISGMAEVGHALIEKYGRFVVRLIIDIPCLFMVLFLYFLSMRDLRGMKTQVANLPGRIRVIVRFSTVHLLAACLVTFPFITFFLVMRLKVIEPHGTGRMFFWSIVFFKSLPLLNVYNVFSLNRRCRQVITLTSFMRR